jgi:hypothetical protein
MRTSRRRPENEHDIGWEWMVVTINIPLRGGYLGFGLTIMPDSPVHNRGSLSTKGG